MQTQPYNQPKRPGIFVASSEAQLIVYLEEIGQSYPKFAKVEERPMLAGAIGAFMVTTHFTTWIFLGRGISLSPRRSYICLCSGSAILHSLR